MKKTKTKTDEIKQKRNVFFSGKKISTTENGTTILIFFMCKCSSTCNIYFNV